MTNYDPSYDDKILELVYRPATGWLLRYSQLAIWPVGRRIELQEQITSKEVVEFIDKGWI